MRTRPHAAPSLFAATAAILAASMLASSPIAGAQAVNPSSNTTTIAAAPTVTAGQFSPSDRWTRLRQAPGTGALSVAFASPTGQLRTVRQASELRWVFDRPVIALGDIAKQPTADVMIEPALPGTLRWASTRVLILTPKVRARLSTRYAAALRWPGLASPKSTVFETPRVSCTLYSTADGWADVQRQSSILVTCTQPVDGADLAGRVTLHFTPNGPKAEMAADPEGKRRLSLVRAEAVRTTTFDRTGRCPESDPRQACHWLKVNGDIPLSSDGTVRFADGIKSTEGPLPSLRVAPSSVSVPAQPVVLATGCRSDCNPADGIPIEIHGAYDQEAFTGKVTRRDLASGVTVINDGDGSAFNGLASLRTYDIEVSPDLTDSTGHRLGYRSVFRFTTGRKRAYIAITNGESVLESARGRQLGLIRRNVVSYDLVNRPIAKADIVASIRLVRNPTPTTPNATNPYGRAGTITVPSTPDADRTEDRKSVV